MLPAKHFACQLNTAPTVMSRDVASSLQQACCGGDDEEAQDRPEQDDVRGTCTAEVGTSATCA